MRASTAPWLEHWIARPPSCMASMAARASAARGIQPAQAPAAVDARITLEVRGNRRRADVLDAREPGNGVGIQPEAAEIVREIQHAIPREAGHCRAQQPHVLGLD